MSGALSGLVISETLLHDKKEGIIVACVSVVTGALIILVSVFLIMFLRDGLGLSGII
jgi:hypothetical protein